MLASYSGNMLDENTDVTSVLLQHELLTYHEQLTRPGSYLANRVLSEKLR